MEKVSIGGGHWLDLPAARSWLRCVEAGCPSSVTSAGRTREEQQALRDKYLAGTGNFAWPPDDPRANHVGGRAVDLPWGGRTWMRNKGAGWRTGAPTWNEWGWSAVENEDWHFNYSPVHDKHLEDDMLSEDDIRKVAVAVWAETPAKYPYSTGTALRNVDNRTQAIAREQIDPAELAALIVAAIPDDGPAVDQATIEKAFRNVLASLGTE